MYLTSLISQLSNYYNMHDISQWVGDTYTFVTTSTDTLNLSIYNRIWFSWKKTPCMGITAEFSLRAISVDMLTEATAATQILNYPRLSRIASKCATPEERF